MLGDDRINCCFAAFVTRFAGVMGTQESVVSRFDKARLYFWSFLSRLKDRE